MVAILLEYLSTALLSAFVAIFIIPVICVQLLHNLPRTVYAICKREIERRACIVPILQIVCWIAIVSVLYVIARLLDRHAIGLILESSVSIVFFLAGSICAILITIRSRQDIEKAFFEDCYTPYMTEETKQKYLSLKIFVETLTREEVLAMLQQEQMPQLSKRALKEYLWDLMA